MRDSLKQRNESSYFSFKNYTSFHKKCLQNLHACSYSLSLCKTSAFVEGSTCSCAWKCTCAFASDASAIEVEGERVVDLLGGGTPLSVSADGLGPPNNLTLCAFEPAEAELARTIGAYWTAFAASADPNTDTPTRTSTPHWPRSAGGAKGATQLLVVPDEEGELGPVTGLRQPACEFWERLFAGGAVEEEEVYP